MRRTSFFLAAILLVSLLLGACGPTPTQTPTDSPLPPPTEPAAGLTLTDALGREVEFKALPERIVVAGRSSLTIVDTLYLFPETSERLAALVIGRQPVGDFVSLVDPAWDQKAILAPDAGPEQIAPLDPDVVLLRSFMAESLGRSLEELEIPVVYLDLETPDQYFRDVLTLGQLLENDERAGEIRAYYQARLDHIVGTVQALPADETPGVLLVQYSDQGGEVALEVPSASWLQTTEVELAGGRPIWSEAARAGGWTVVNFEQIAAWDPDKVFVIHYRADSAEVVDRLAADAQWQALRAVEAGEIYGFPADVFSWDQPDPRWILGVTWLAGKIHPDRFPDLDVRQKVVEFFSQMYGMDEAAVEAQILPTLSGDVE